MDKSSLPVPTDDEAAKALAAARNRAAVALDDVLFNLHLRAIDTGSSIKQLLDMGEHFYKVSGLGAKQAAQVSQGNGFRLNIILNGARADTGVTIEAVPEADMLDGDPPLAAALFHMTGDLESIGEEQ